MLYTVDSVSKNSAISMVYVASSMRSAKLFWVSKPKKLNKINKKAAFRSSFFCCQLVAQNEKRTKIELGITKIWQHFFTDILQALGTGFTDFAKKHATER